jgi:ATP-dependent 26S proteasome regulatory subunit
VCGAQYLTDCYARAGAAAAQVKTLFAVAGVMQPSVIFIDEIDSILSARKSEGVCTSSCCDLQAAFATPQQNSLHSKAAAC